MERYKHTETGWILIAILGAATVFSLGVGAIVRSAGHSPAAYFVPVILVAALANFYKLTVTVDDRAVRISMGMGLIRRKFLLADISAAGVNKNPMYCGWGIHLTKDGWLYNVNSQEAVKLEMKSGSRCQIGTDEPQVFLAAFLNAGVPPGN